MSTDLKSIARQAPLAGTRKPPEHHRLSLSTEPHRASVEPRNPDPYNSSGSFDRTKNWARVGKR